MYRYLGWTMMMIMMMMMMMMIIIIIVLVQRFNGVLLHDSFVFEDCPE